jgi:hypothetical protein
MTIPSFITAAGLQIPIRDGWGGPQLAHSKPFEALAWVVNRWIHGEFPDLLAQIERGEDADDPMNGGFFAAQPYPEDVTLERKALWKELTNQDIGDDIVLVGSPMTRDSFLLPRTALAQILRATAKMRAEAAKLPRAPRGAPSSNTTHPELHHRELFTQEPTNQPPSEDERVALGDVEDAAVALDAMEANIKTDRDRLETIAARRTLLEKLEFWGLVDEPRSSEKRAWLEGFRLPTLRDYVDAAIALRAYYRSSARSQYVREPAPQRLIDGSVSLDWFRKPTLTPSGEAGESWLALVERLIQETSPSGNSGEIFASIGDRKYPILWRRDYYKPAVIGTLDVGDLPYRR